jgi:outer membrane protein assembly factor BamD (BamD/ComL family)
MESFFNNQIKKERMSLGKWKNTKYAEDFNKKYDEILNDLKDKDIFIEKFY